MFMGPYCDTDMTTFSKYRSISSIVIMIKGDGSLLSSPIWLTSLSSIYIYIVTYDFLFYILTYILKLVNILDRK